jgi:hypothetical protein
VYKIRIATASAVQGKEPRLGASTTQARLFHLRGAECPAGREIQ